jgi:outer membrane protein
MKRSLTVVLALASGLGLNATAQTGTAAPASASAAATPAKIAVIAFQAAVAQTNEGQRDFADLRKKYEPKQAQLKAMNDEIDGLQKQLQAQGDKLSDQERNTRVKSIDEKQKILQRNAEDAQNEFQGEMDEVFRGLAQKVYEIVSGFAQQNGYTVVLDISQQNSGVLWANDATNITKAVIDAYNAKSGVPAPPAGTAAPTATPRTTVPKPAAPKQ